MTSLPPPRRKILFVCVGNTCRSQMAEGFAGSYGKDAAEVKSAGTSAMGFVNKSTIEAMNELGIDISGHTSKQLTYEMMEWADVVVTLGCLPASSLCPASYRGRKLDWNIGDPLGKPMDVMRAVRDDIGRRVKGLIDEQDREQDTRR